MDLIPTLEIIKMKQTLIITIVSIVAAFIFELISISPAYELRDCTVQEVTKIDSFFGSEKTRVKFEDGFVRDFYDKKGEVGEVVKLYREVGRTSCFGLFNKRF